MWKGVGQGLLQGVANISINYATQELGLNPLLANIGFSAISAGINAGIQAATGGSKDVFGSLFKTYSDNALTFLGYADPNSPGYAWQQSSYISQIMDFSNIVQERGLVDALNTYGTGFFNAVAVNEITKTGMTLGEYFNNKLDEHAYSSQTIDGKEYAVVDIKDDETSDLLAQALFQQKERSDNSGSYMDFAGFKDINGNNYTLRYGDYGVDAYGKLGVTDGELEAVYEGIRRERQKIKDGQQVYADVYDLRGAGRELLTITPDELLGYNAYGLKGEYVNSVINSQGYTYSLTGNSFQFKNIDNGATILIKDNKITDFSIDNSAGYFDNADIEALSKLSKEDRAKVLSAYMTFGHGFNNEAVVGGMPDIMQLFVKDLMADGIISETSAFGVSIYKGNIFENASRWAKDAWSTDDTLTNEAVAQIKTYLGTLTPEQREAGISHFAHSGNFRPTIEGLNKNPDLNVHTIINYEGPYVGDTVITNSHVKRIINVNGTAPSVTVDNPYTFFKWGLTGPYLDVTQLRYNDAPVPFLGKAEFTGVGRTIDNVNFEMMGARHTDFSHVSGDATNVATNLFMRELSKAATGKTDWNRFINNPGIKAVSYDEIKKVWDYRVDPIAFKRNLSQ